MLTHLKQEYSGSISNHVDKNKQMYDFALSANLLLHSTIAVIRESGKSHCLSFRANEHLNTQCID
jgi:hypothetical protein